MPEPAAENFREVLQRGLQHPPGKLEIGVIAGLGFGREFLRIGDRRRQGTPLLDFLEIVRFVEGEQVDADGGDAAGHRFEQRGGMGCVH